MISIEKIGEIIRFHRRKSGLSRQQLATIAGVGKTTIFDLEHGKLSIRLNTLLKVLTILNIRIELDSPLIS
jgi:transcriptional regulator with XRE-family HTH domain